MLTVFNRRELMVVLSNKQLFRMENALAEAGIHYAVSVLQRGGLLSGRSRKPLLHMSAMDTMQQYKIYVHKNDYDRAKTAIQPALQGL